MKKRIYILINGILKWPGAADNWTDKGVTWIHVNTPYRAEKFEYWSLIFTRRLRQQWRAEQLAALIKDYARHEIHLVAHSNGADVVIRALRILDMDTRIEDAHLLAPACDTETAMKVLGEYSRANALHAAYIYVGGQDKAMRLAKLSRLIGGLWGLGYGAMGGKSKLDLSLRMAAKNIRGGVIERPTYEHSDWFLPGHNFRDTMSIVTGMGDQ